MAPRGIGAAVVIIALVLSMTLLSGIGYYSLLGTTVNTTGQSEDVQAAAEQLDGIGFAEGRSASILEGPLAVVTPAIGIFQTFTTIVFNTSGVLQLLYGLPKGAADVIETLFRIAMIITALYLIRSGSPV